MQPPPGYDDLLGDADAAPPGEFITVTVDGVGRLEVRRPAPRAAAALAMSTVEHGPWWVGRFADEALRPGRFDALMGDLLQARVPPDAVGRVARAAATVGTARSWRAVVVLCGITGQYWRTVRAHLITHGVTDPMGLPSLHALLDVTEAMVLENIGGKPAEAKAARQRFTDQVYRPETVTVGGAAQAPPGFSDADTEAAFDAFSKVAAL